MKKLVEAGHEVFDDYEKSSEDKSSVRETPEDLLAPKERVSQDSIITDKDQSFFGTISTKSKK